MHCASQPSAVSGHASRSRLYQSSNRYLRTLMALDNFHPVIHRWFSEPLGQPTAAQQQGWAAIREGRHTLIAAPTGSGKTLAAFLSALNDLFEEGLRGPLPDEV